MHLYIYKITNKINGKIYIGKRHSNCIPEKDIKYMGSGIIINKSIKRYGKENFKKEILCECYNEDELNEKEKYYINLFNSRDLTIGYNITEGGCGNIHNEDSKLKMSRSHKGKKFTEEHKRKISESNKGKKLSEETRLKLSIVNLGKIISEESKRKISEKLKGVSKSEEFKEKHRGNNNANSWYQLKLRGEEHSRGMLGKHHSEETKLKMSYRFKDKDYIERYGEEKAKEIKQKLSESQVGRKHSEETKRKIGLVHKNKIVSKETRIKQSIGKKNQIQLECPYCHKICGQINAKKYHFDRCLQNPNLPLDEIKRLRNANNSRSKKLIINNSNIDLEYFNG